MTSDDACLKIRAIVKKNIPSKRSCSLIDGADRAKAWKAQDGRFSGLQENCFSSTYIPKFRPK